MLLSPRILLSCLIAVVVASPGFAQVNPKPEAVVLHYADLAHALYSDALTGARNLQAATDTLLAEPSAAHLKAARDAWLAARIPYLQSEVLRFGNPVVDDWEGKLNAWPLDEGLIDYVAGDYHSELGNPAARANIIANPELQISGTTLDAKAITPELLTELHELAGSEANVTSGYHAIEFLLWGQDLHGSGPGAGERPYTDFSVGEACTGGQCQRRADYLRAAVTLLIQDLDWMVAQWAPGQTDNYRAELKALPPEQALGRALFGMGSLSLGELAGERMKVALEANSTEDEQDCFSDNTHWAHFYNGLGIRNIYLGEYRRPNGELLQGPSIASLINARDPALDSRTRSALDTSQAALQAMVDNAEAEPAMKFDQMVAPGNTEGERLIANTIKALTAQTTLLEQLAPSLGIDSLHATGVGHAAE